MESTPHINYFAQTDFRGKKSTFGIKSEDRAKHIYVIGKTGMGKSTLLENLAIQDIKNGAGMAFIDPHGKSAEMLLDYIPKERIKDVVYFAPFDLANPVAFNIMEDVGPDYRHLVADGLMATFKKIWQDAWSARMEYILNNTLLALLEYPDATLLGVNRMLSDKVYRKKVVDNISDPSVRSFWVDEFAGYTDRFAAEATPAIQNKIGQFTNNPLIRNIIGQSKSSFDLRQLMDDGKILIINLSKGLVGEQNTQLLGGMLVTKIYLAAMSRANATQAQLHQLPSFYLYVDEFQSFANESFADILSEARKYKLSLTIAHQYIEQMPEEVRDAVFGNVGTIITFRVGPFDAEVLETIFTPTFIGENLVNLGQFQMYLTLMIDGVGSRPFSAVTLPPIVNIEPSYKDEVIKNSQDTYGHKRAEVEKKIIDWVNDGRAGDSSTGNNNKQDKRPFSPTRNSSPKNKESITPKSNVNQPAQSINQSPPVKKDLTPVKMSTQTVSLKDLSRKTHSVKSKSSDSGRLALRDALKDLLVPDNKSSAEPATKIGKIGKEDSPDQIKSTTAKDKSESTNKFKKNTNWQNKPKQSENLMSADNQATNNRQEVSEEKLKSILSLNEKDNIK